MKQEFLDSALASRRKLIASLAGIDESALVEIPIEGTWTARDILVHIAATDGAILRAARHARRGEPVVWGWEGYADVDSFNAADVERRQGLTVGEVVAELDDSRKLLLEEFADWPDELGPFGPESWDLEKSQIGWLASHETEHARAVETLRTTRE